MLNFGGVPGCFLWIFFKGNLDCWVLGGEVDGNSQQLRTFFQEKNLVAEIFERYSSIPVVGHEVNLSELKN